MFNSVSGIQTFDVEAITATVLNGVWTITVATAIGSLINNQVYEYGLAVLSTVGSSDFSTTGTITPSNLPATLQSPTINTYYSSGTTLDATNAAIFTATYKDSDATNPDNVLVVFGVVDANEADGIHATKRVTQDPFTTQEAIDAADMTTAATAIAPCNIPDAWFSGVTQIEITAFVQQTTNSVVTKGLTCAPTTTYKITLPLINPINIVSVSDVGLQTFSTSGTVVDAIAVVAYNYGQTGVGVPPLTGAINLTNNGVPDANGAFTTAANPPTLSYVNVAAWTCCW